MKRRKKNLKIAAVLFGAVLLVAVSTGLWAAPKLTASKAKPGDCVACHADNKVLPQTHPDTRSMDMKACQACHTVDNMKLSGKFPASHTHLLSGVDCAACHGKTKQPEEVPMEKCVACHGSTAKLAEKTKDVKPTNPHTSPHYGTDLDCNLCHKQHAKSGNYCLQCHKFDFKVP